MSQRILGVDLGTYSVKVAELQTGFRQLQLVAVHERLLPSGDGSLAERAAATLAALIAEKQLAEPTVYAALSGSQVSLRTLVLPFTEARKIEPVLPFELEAMIPFPIEDLVIDYAELDRVGEGTRILAVAARKEEVSQVIDRISGASGTEPRALYLAPLAYHALTHRLPASDGLPRAVIDIGHCNTNLCILAGRDAPSSRPQFARTITRGGHNLTQAVAREYNVDYDKAEGAKHRADVMLYAPGDAPSEKLGHFADVLRDALEPLCAELNQSFAAYHAEFGARPVEVLLLGGSARLKGLDAHLSERLDVPVRELALSGLPELAHAAEAHRPEAALAIATALTAADGRREVDLRRGTLAYKSDYSFLRARALQIVACMLVVLAASAVDAYASLYKLRREESLLSERLKRETQEVFGQPMVDPEEVTKRMSLGRKGVDVPTVEATGLDLLEEISRKIPAAEKAKIDITELEIRGKKSFMKGTSDSAAIVDDIAKGLEQIDCFGDVQKGPISNASVEKELKSWSITVTSRCP